MEEVFLPGFQFQPPLNKEGIYSSETFFPPRPNSELCYQDVSQRWPQPISLSWSCRGGHPDS